MKIKTLKDIEHLDGVKVFLRADFNVPIKDGVVANDFRIKATLPTIEYLRSRGAIVILASHLEANDGGNPSLKPVAESLKKLGVQVTFIDNYARAYDVIESEAKTQNLETKETGPCFLLENLRFNAGEKKNDPKFAKELASLSDIYVNDAFSVCHREHASIVGIPKFIPSYAGLQLEREVENLSKAFTPAHPFLFILCGAKFETKLPLLEKFIDSADSVFVGGALANDFFKLKGYEVGSSLISVGDIDLSKYVNNPKLLLPVDVTTGAHEVKIVDSLAKTDAIMDAGPKTLALLAEKIAQARFILWNGPLGMYEDGFKGPTLEVARLIGEVAGSVSIVGGGDTLAAIAELGNQDKYTFISTAGGAMLDFLAKGTLPGIRALENSTE